MRTFYRLLSILGIARAAGRGVGPLARNWARRHAHRTLARLMRRSGL